MLVRGGEVVHFAGARPEGLGQSLQDPQIRIDNMVSVMMHTHQPQQGLSHAGRQHDRQQSKAKAIDHRI